MKNYLLYGQVRRRIEETAERGAAVSFVDASLDLMKEGASLTAPELPAASFLEWDCEDMDAFRRLMDDAPVDLNIFTDDPAALSHVDHTPVKYVEGELTSRHRHPFFELTYVLDGQAKIDLGRSLRTLNTGGLCLVAPGSLHDVMVERGSLVVSVLLSAHTVEHTLFRLLQSENVVTDFFRASLDRGSRGYMLFRLPVDREVCLHIRNIFHHAYSRKAYAQYMFTDSVELFFCCLLQNYAADWEQYSEDRTDGPAGLLPVLQYIQANYKSATLKETAARFHYEPSYLGKLIKAQTGRNYTDIIARLRIGEAKRLLTTTQLSMEAVAEQAGFQSAVHFSRSFRQHTGLSPRQYRKCPR